MTKRVTTYVACVAVSAVAATIMLAGFGQHASFMGAATAAFLCAIGWVARRLTYEGVAEGTVGRVYYLVFPAAGLAVGDWTVPVAVAVTVFAIEITRGAEWHKVIFNTAAPALASAGSIAAFSAVGGSPWREHPALSAIPIIALIVSSRAINDLTLAGVLSIAQAQPIRTTWRALFGRTLVDDVLVAPIVWLLAYAVVSWGIAGTLAVAASLVWIHRLYRTNRALTRLSRELLELMVTAIEARDPYTSGHSRRVSRMAMEIAGCLGLSQHDVDRIGVAGLLHDVGKIHEKYAVILQKPDRLSKDEWLLMKEHPADGETLVRKVSALHDILPAVRHHHERWDGSGYPDGLRGNAIPLMARVMTFADTIDAMTSDRPYRRGLTQGEVRLEIEKHAGRQFDPVIAERLLKSTAWATLIQPSEPESANVRYGLRLVDQPVPAAV
jgi:HD-GYP domain-containing protein (c-di-GMP phosphodiesterase class II)